MWSRRTLGMPPENKRNLVSSLFCLFGQRALGLSGNKTDTNKNIMDKIFIQNLTKFWNGAPAILENGKTLGTRLINL